MLHVIVPPLTGDWNHTDGKRLEAAVHVCISNIQGWVQSSVSMCKVQSSPVVNKEKGEDWQLKDWGLELLMKLFAV